MTTPRIQPAMIGAFVVLSLVLFMTAIVVFSGNRFFDKDNLFITYFEGSLNGLSVGAPVTYRGVTIGQVKDIKIHIQSNEQQSQDILIPVLISLSAGETLIVDKNTGHRDTEVNVFMESVCDKGLRAKLKLQSLVTGKRYIDLAFYKGSPAIYRDTGEKYLEIPSIPSDIQQFSRMIETINVTELYSTFMRTMDSLEKLTSGLAEVVDRDKSKRLLDELLLASTQLNSLLSQGDTAMPLLLKKMDRGLDQLSDLTRHTDGMITSLDRQLGPLGSDIRGILSLFTGTMLQAKTFIAQAERSIRPNSPLSYQFTKTMGQLEKTGKSLQQLSEYIHRNPDTLIFGRQKATTRQEGQ